MVFVLIAVAIVAATYLFGETLAPVTNDATPSGGIPEQIGLTTLSPSDIAAYAESAGFSGSDLIAAVAIALAESGGNPNAYNAETAAGTPHGKGSYGLWQIYLNAHPEFSGQNLYDPQVNANAAYEVYLTASGFMPWSTYKNNAYLNYAAVAGAAIGA